MEQIFFQFLRLGLWGNEEILAGLQLSHKEWEQLFLQAHSQAVTGIFIDGVSRTDKRPDEFLWGQWLMHLYYLEQTNEYIANRGAWWIRQLANVGIKATIFKGSSVAAWYPSPMHRSYGDIDLIVTGSRQNLTMALLKRGIIPYEQTSVETVVNDKNGIYVEFHTEWEYLYNPLTNARLQRFCRKAGGEDKELYFVCLILHIQRHFLTYGIGLKHVCDVAVMLHNAQLDYHKVAHLLKIFHAKTFSSLLFGFISVYLGGTEQYPLLPISQGKRFELLKSVILRDGYYRKVEQVAISKQRKSSFSRIANNAWFWLQRSLRMFCIMPGEACCFLSYKTWQRIKSVAQPRK